MLPRIGSKSAATLIRKTDGPFGGSVEKVGLLLAGIVLPMPKPYEGGKRRHHFTLSDQAYDHLTAIALEGRLSRSETLERLVRSTAISEGSSLLSDDIWPLVIDHSFSS